jgi:prepilin-type N-terminal cleavage/methylation domain-containing protein
MPTREDGFTLIELMIAILISGALAALAGPALNTARTINNENGALATMAVFKAAEHTHQAEVGNSSFGNSKDLFDEGLIDAGTYAGRVHGYDFTLTLSEDHLHYQVSACPAAVNRSGVHCFFTDDASDVARVCPFGQQLDPATGRCEPENAFLPISTTAFIQQVNALSGGAALPVAQAVAHTTASLGQQAIAALMDTNHDGMLTFDEALNPNVLGASLAPVMSTIIGVIRSDLALGVANEQLPAIQISGIGGDLAAFLDGIPPAPPPHP